MKRKCTTCGVITEDDRLIACPGCGANFSSGEPDRNLLTPQQEKYIVSKIWNKHWKFLFGGFSVLMIISVLLLVYAFVQAYRSGIDSIEKMLTTKIATEFEEPKIREVIEQVAKAEAQSVITNQINPTVEDFKARIDRVKPPALKLTSHDTEKLDTGYKITLQFTPSKNEPLGVIIFHASVDDDSDVRILDFWPSKGVFRHGKDSKKIEEDGKQALLRYSLLGVGRPSIDLTISGKARIKIQGNYLDEALLITPSRGPT
jgi:hypothetical protein